MIINISLKDDRPQMTQKEAFIFYLQRMNTDMLEVVLPDNICYFGAHKSEFLDKLSYIFNQLKLGGEKGLLQIKLNKENNNIFYLVSQVFGYEQEFIMEEKNGNIVNISDSKVINSLEEIEWLSHWEIFFGDDEKAEFIPSNEYVLKLHHCINAYEEIVNSEIQTYTGDDISNWVKKYQSLYEEVENDILWFKLNDFRNLFSHLEFIMSALKKHNEVKIALKSFDDSGSEAINKWVVDNNRLFFCGVLYFEGFFRVIDSINKTLKLTTYPNVDVIGQEFLDIIKFNELYMKHCIFQESVEEVDDVPF